MKHLKYLNKYFYKYRYRLIIGAFFVTISNYFGVLSPQVIRLAFDLVRENIILYQLYDGFSLQQEFYKLFSYILLLFGAIILILAILKGLFMFFMRQNIIVMSRYIEYDLKNELYAHYQALSLTFYKRNNTGDLMSRISEDISRVRMYLGPAVMYSINLVVVFIMVISAMISVSPKLTLYVLLPLPVLSLSIYYISHLINIKSELIQSKLSDLTTAAQEYFSGIRVVKSYVREKIIGKFFEQNAEEYKTEALNLAQINAFFFPLMMLLIGLSTILTIYVGGRGVINGQITAGNIAEFVIYVNMLTWPVTVVGWVTSIIQRAAASQKRINELLNIPVDIVSKTDEPIQLKGKIEFKNVTFTYPDTGIKALNNVSFKVNTGENIAIIGKTGSGKTTLAELLVRMYDVENGEILLDDKKIDEINLNALRTHIGYVTQDVFLFSDTVRNNISFGSNIKDDNKIIEAAKQAAIHNEILTLDNNYKSIVGERGVTLSGGQKQRISIARAFVKNPEILILDDCLSAVDAKTEKTILSNLNDVLKDKSAIIITHRIFSLLNFDNIIVLENGSIAEQGTHDNLMRKKGVYYDLYLKQQQKEELLS